MATSKNILTGLVSATGNPFSIATSPHFILPYSQNMNLWERLKNFALIVMEEAVRIFFSDAMKNHFYSTHFPNESKTVPYANLHNRISLVFANSHPSVSFARPLMPNVIEIAGYHIDESKSTLGDLQIDMDSAKQGVIYFSLGSISTGNMMNSAMRNIFAKAFSKRKELILWKSEETIENTSNNVIVRSWMPQISILAHPNAKLFITHGGFLSCTEASHFGVPLIVVPIFSDQFHNAKMVAERGQGVVLHSNNVTEDSLQWAMDEIVSDKNRYVKNAMHVKDVFHDRPIGAKQLILYYVDHVIRTRGAKHLRVPKLPRYSLMLLDVFALISLVILCTIVLLWVCLKKKFNCDLWRRNVDII